MIDIQEYKAPVYLVHSLAEYMEVIKIHGLEKSISRGESRRYPALQAAAFRRNSSLDIKAMADEFQSYIGNTLTEMQNKHFLAFCQHYGLPTNLLDFTHSPLISLYFACAGHEGEPGIVYLINSDRLIDLSGRLELMNSIFFPRFLSADEELFELFHGITNVFLQDKYILELLTQIDGLIGACPGCEAIHSEIQRLLRSERVDNLDRLVALMDKRVRSVKGLASVWSLRRLSVFSHLYIQFLNLLLFLAHHYEPFVLPFYFTYEPANITNRVSNQSSIFIYQLYGLDNMRQAIQPDHLIEIENKADILADLDCMGINEKFIFNDYDHIASYIKQKHLKLSDIQEEKLQNLKRMSRELMERSSKT